jgi:hypothetical protein
MFSMKKLYSLLLLLGLGLSMFARQIGVNYAMQVAKNFYSQTTGISSENIQLAYQCKTNDNVGRTSDGKSVYYVFNVGADKGFIIVSGDDLVQPILGYNTKGNYSATNHSHAFTAWINNYKAQIVFAIENRTSATTAVESQWYRYYNNITEKSGSRSTQAVNPLCQTTWNQNPYYNNLCPYDQNQGAHCVTGCVATAMAQIIKYWNYPAQGVGNHSYNNPNYGTLSANYGATTYNWGAMPNAINSDNNDVETLMLHCGIGVDMNYGVQESSAWVITADANGGACAQTAYTSYFGYDPATIQGLKRDSYSDQDWTNMVLTELNASRPVQYAGFGQGGGHTWVCDGYDGNGNFHMNWGWGGQDDGYYPLNALNPTNLGTGGGDGAFNSGQEILIGIKPLNNNGGGGGNTVNQDSMFLYSNITVSANPVQSGSQFTVSVDIANGGSGPFTGDLTAAVFNSDGVFNGTIQILTNQSLAAHYYNTYNFTIDTLNLIPGLYYIGIYYRNGSNNYSLVNPSTYNNPVTINVTGPYSDIQMYSNDTIYPARPQVNQAFSVHANIANIGSSAFNGYLDASLYDLDGNYITDIQQFQISMQAGYYYNCRFNTTGLNVNPGTYYVAFWSSPDNQNWTLVYNQNYPNPVEVTIVSQPLNPDIYEQDNTEQTAYTLPVNFTGNSAQVNTAGSNIHVGNDYDYYKINLPSGTNYSITATVQDSKNSSFTDDVLFSYKVNSSSWSDAYSDNAPGPIYVQDGGTVVFLVADNFLGSIGTYQLNLSIVSGPNVGINEPGNTSIDLFPNPATDKLLISTGDMQGNYTVQIFNTMGQLVHTAYGELNGQPVQTDVSHLASGVYTIQMHTQSGIANAKFVVR